MKNIKNILICGKDYARKEKSFKGFSLFRKRKLKNQSSIYMLKWMRLKTNFIKLKRIKKKSMALKDKVIIVINIFAIQVYYNYATLLIQSQQ